MQFIVYIEKNVPGEVSTRLKAYFRTAAKLSSTNEEEAYLLGLLLRRAIREGIITESIENHVEGVAKVHPSAPYYSLEYKPHWNNWYEFAFVVAIFGAMGIGVGVYDGFLTGNEPFHTLFPFDFNRGAGYALIGGLVMFIGGISKVRQEAKRNKILKQMED